MDGRDAWLFGRVADAGAKARAEQAVAGVSGVRVVHNLLSVGGAVSRPAPAAPPPAAPAAPAPATPAAPAPAPVSPPIAGPAASGDIQRSLDDLIAGRVIEFEPGRDRLTKSGAALVDEVAALLARFPSARVAIAGHTDSQGTSRNNLTISQRRAEAVRRRLVSGGVAESRLMAEGYGEDRPIADNRTAEGRLRNRRVEFTVQ